MDSFIITGANTEPAQSIARRLCEAGARVYGLAGTFPENSFSDAAFVPVACDLTNAVIVAEKIKEILATEKDICGLILCVQPCSEDAFESVSVEEISLTVGAFVATPLVIARLILPRLIATRGSLIAISSNTTTPRGHVLNTIAESAMKVLAATLFGELRDTGVRTCHILLQNNTGAQDAAAKFTNAPQSRIQPALVADAVETVLKFRENNALTQLVLRPQATRETPHIPVSAEPRIRALQSVQVQLPTAKNFPPEEEAILTEKYHRPDYAPSRKEKIRELATNENRDNDDDVADDYVDPELRYLLKHRDNNNENRGGQGRQNPPEQRLNFQNRQGGGQGAQQSQAQNPAPVQLDEFGNPIRKKRRRHRNRNRKRNGAIMIRPPQIGDNGAQPAGGNNAPATTGPRATTNPTATTDPAATNPAEKVDTTMVAREKTPESVATNPTPTTNPSPATNPTPTTNPPAPATVAENISHHQPAEIRDHQPASDNPESPKKRPRKPKKISRDKAAGDGASAATDSESAKPATVRKPAKKSAPRKSRSATKPKRAEKNSGEKTADNDVARGE
ncbi:MAG: hypothetical protein LUD39_05655 [Opitutae bacterium]|nr:hypothetical protein [Opitutae bacterium]